MGSLANKDFSLSTETMVWDLVWERGQGGEASISMVAQPRGEALEGNYGGLGCEALKGRWLQGNWDLGGLQQHTVLLHHALHFHSTFHCTVEVSRPPPSLHWHWPRCQGCLMSGQICECEVREHGTPILLHPARRRWHELWPNLLSPLSWGQCLLDKCRNMRRCIFEACPPEFVWLLINIRPGSFCKRCDASMFNFRLTSFEYSDFDQLVKALMLAFYCVGMKLMWLWNISHLSSLWLWTEWMKRRRGKNWSVA